MVVSADLMGMFNAATGAAPPEEGGESESPLRPGTGAGNPASFDDIVVQQNQESFNPLREMMAWSTRFEECIARANLTEDEATDLLRCYMMHELARTGTWQFLTMIWIKMGLGVSVDAMARNQAAEMYGGFGNAAKRMAASMFGSGQSAGPNKRGSQDAN